MLFFQRLILFFPNTIRYRIDDIRFDLCPTDTFPTKDGEISYVDYYKVSEQTNANTHFCYMHSFMLCRNTIKRSKT